MSASEKLRALEARFEDDYYGAADASAHALSLITDVIAAAEGLVPRILDRNPSRKETVLLDALGALREHLEGQ